VIAVIGTCVALFMRWIKTTVGHEKWDRFKLRPPVFGPLAHKVALARMTGTLSSLVTAGVPIIESLGIVADNVGNVIVAEAVRGAQQGVREGRSLGSSLSDYEVMPSMVTQMIDTGEESGALDDMLDKISTFYDSEVTATVNSLTSVLEPLIIVFMGCVVGAIVISLYLPMFDYVHLLNNPNGAAGKP
jgi:type IV pilus assembly protein PilC